MTENGAENCQNGEGVAILVDNERLCGKIYTYWDGFTGVLVGNCVYWECVLKDGLLRRGSGRVAV